MYCTVLRVGQLPLRARTPARIFNISKDTNTENASTGINYTRFIFCFGVFDGFVFVSADFHFLDFATSFGTGAVNRKLRNRENGNRRKQNFTSQKQIQNHQKQQNKK